MSRTQPQTALEIARRTRAVPVVAAIMLAYGLFAAARDEWPTTLDWRPAAWLLDHSPWWMLVGGSLSLILWATFEWGYETVSADEERRRPRLIVEIDPARYSVSDDNHRSLWLLAKAVGNHTAQACWAELISIISQDGEPVFVPLPGRLPWDGYPHGRMNVDRSGWRINLASFDRRHLGNYRFAFPLDGRLDYPLEAGTYDVRVRVGGEGFEPTEASFAVQYIAPGRQTSGGLDFVT